MGPGRLQIMDLALEFDPQSSRACSQIEPSSGVSRETSPVPLLTLTGLSSWLNPRFTRGLCRSWGPSLSQGRFRHGAVQDNTKALELNPRLADAYINRGRAQHG